MIDMNEGMRLVSIYALPVLFAITLHEAAHAWAAKRLGDKTAFMLGRVTLNPMRHIDPVGTVLVPLFFLLSSSGFFMGWAKPVPVNTRGLRKPQRDMALVAAAGPCANLLMAIIWGWLGVLALQGWTGQFGYPLSAMAAAGVRFNVFLMVFNLLPLPPLDGSKVLMGFLPRDLAQQYSRLEPFGFYILMALLFSHMLDGPLQLMYMLGSRFASFFIYPFH